jgi:hypothetical protein
VLGARHAAEAVVLARRPGPSVRRIVTGVDLLHGASMVALAVLSPRYRRIATASALAAGALGLAGLLADDGCAPAGR